MALDMRNRGAPMAGMGSERLVLTWVCRRRIGRGRGSGLRWPGRRFQRRRRYVLAPIADVLSERGGRPSLLRPLPDHCDRCRDVAVMEDEEDAGKFFGGSGVDGADLALAMVEQTGTA